MRNDTTIRKYVSSGGTVVYKMPVMAYKNHVTNCYLTLGNTLTLIDTGSGFEESNQELELRFEELRRDHGEKIEIRDIERVIITHGHVDHFGGLNYILERATPKVAVHELDLTTLSEFYPRLIVNSKNLRIYLNRAGLPEERVRELLDRNKWSKESFRPIPVADVLSEGRFDEFQIYHAPGHCPGQICLQLDDILFSADHVLSHVTPNQSPEFITRYNGLGHYLESLEKIRAVEGVRIALGGHEEEIHDIGARIDATIQFHRDRLERARRLCAEPKTIDQVSVEMFPFAKGYHVLLALLEAGAHVEYLYERGIMTVANIEEIEQEDNPVLYYQNRE